MTALVLAACGSSSSSTSGAGAQTLLKQTFSGSHSVKSGLLNFNLTLTPSGSSTLKGPLSVGLSGPFQTRGKGQLPASNFTISINALGHKGALGLVSTGTSGYLTLQGAAYQLPAADFQKLASSFSGASGAAGGGTGGLAKLGIEPLHWLTNASIVGNDTVAGASTTHIRAGVNVSALLGDFNYIPAEGVRQRRGRHDHDPQLDPAGHDEQDRRRDQEPGRRRLDRDQRQDPA